jgi:hypothetical protein
VFDPPHERQLPNWTLEAAQARLRADGWTLGLVREKARQAWEDKPETHVHTFQATRNGYKLHALAATASPGGFPSTTCTWASTRSRQAGNPGRSGRAGWLAGAITGWLLTGFAGCRLRGRALPRRLAALALCQRSFRSPGGRTWGMALARIL